MTNPLDPTQPEHPDNRQSTFTTPPPSDREEIPDAKPSLWSRLKRAILGESSLANWTSRKVDPQREDLQRKLAGRLTRARAKAGDDRGPVKPQDIAPEAVDPMYKKRMELVEEGAELLFKAVDLATAEGRGMADAEVGKLYMRASLCFGKATVFKHFAWVMDYAEEVGLACSLGGYFWHRKAALNAGEPEDAGAEDSESPDNGDSKAGARKNDGAKKRAKAKS